MEHRCGHQVDVCGDPEKLWYPQRKVCYASMEEESAKRTYAKIHADRPYHNGNFTVWTVEPTAKTPFHFWDGVEIYVAESDLHPDDMFLSPISAFVADDEPDAGPREVPA